MDKKEINYVEIMDVFQTEHDVEIHNFIDKIVGDLEEDDPNRPGTVHIDLAQEHTMKCKEVAFAVAAALFSMVEICNGRKEALKALNDAKQLIRESGILPYLSIENRSQNHGKRPTMHDFFTRLPESAPL